MVVKNKKKFVRAILLIIGISIGINLLISTTAFSHQDLKYKTVSVSSGDTLWNIAEKYMNNDYDSVQAYMKELKEINGLSGDKIYEGKYLMVPYYN